VTENMILLVTTLLPTSSVFQRFRAIIYIFLLATGGTAGWRSRNPWVPQNPSRKPLMYNVHQPTKYTSRCDDDIIFVCEAMSVILQK